MATEENPFKRFCPEFQFQIQSHFPPDFKVLTSHFPTAPLSLNGTLEDTFGFTLCHSDTRQFLLNNKYLSSKSVAKELTYLPLTATQSDQCVYVWHPLLSLANLEVALKEYLEVLSGTQAGTLKYLFSCFVKVSSLQDSELRSSCIPLLLSSVATEITSGSNDTLADDVMRMCRMEFVSVRATQSQTVEFVIHLTEQLSHEEMCRIFTPLLLNFSQPFLSNPSPDVIPLYHFVPYSVLFCVPKVAHLFTSLLLDLRGVNMPLDFERRTILGPLFRVSPLNTSPSYFEDANSLTTDSIERTCGMLDQKLTDLCEVAHQTLVPLFKHSPHSVFLWLSLFLRHNHSRASLGQQLATNTLQLPLCASDGMGLNVTTVLLRFCHKLRARHILEKINPFFCLIENSSGLEDAVSRIRTNPNLVPITHILELSRESKLCSCEDTEDLILDLSPDFSFATQLFHLTHFALSVYYVPVIDTFISKSRQLAEIKDLMSATFQEPLMERAYRQQISSYLSLKSHLLSHQLVEMLTQFCLLSCDWFLFLTGSKHDVTAQIASIPEFYLSNVLEILQFFSATCKDTLATLQGDYSAFIHFATIFLNHSGLITNPHKRGKIAEVLGTLTHSDSDTGHFLVSQTERIRATLQSDQMALRHFLPGLLKVFAEIEVVGDDLEFEQKFTYRHSMYDLIEFLWSSAPFRPCLDTLCREVLERTYSSPPVLLRFLNALINDSTFLLDEGLSHVQRVAAIEKLKSGTEWQKLSQEERTAKISELGLETRMGRTMNRLAERTIHTLVTISHQTPEILTIPAQIDSLAGMLNCFLDQLTGSKNRTLNVSDREQLHFRPLALLCDLLEVYFNLSQFDTFLSAVVKDGRSFKASLLTNTQKVLGVAKAPYEKTEKWFQICGKLRDARDRLECDEVSMDSVPDEFLDALMNTLMSDPILLPSGNVVDRATIERHILNQKNDPFSRQPLSLEELEPIPELKSRIEKWHSDRKDQSDA